MIYGWSICLKATLIWRRKIVLLQKEWQLTINHLRHHLAKRWSWGPTDHKNLNQNMIPFSFWNWKRGKKSFDHSWDKTANIIIARAEPKTTCSLSQTVLKNAILFSTILWHSEMFTGSFKLPSLAPVLEVPSPAHTDITTQSTVMWSFDVMVFTVWFLIWCNCPCD